MPFKKLVNFRDLGDYRVANGQKIKPGKLLRSGEPVDLPEEEKQRLQEEYQLHHIIDFRTLTEISERPVDKIDGAIYMHIDMFGSTDSNQAPSLRAMLNITEEMSAFDVMLHTYKHLVQSPVSQAGYREFFYILLNNEKGACLWHCFAGKDRTGLGGALILYLLGASKETIYEDFLRTNESRRPANEAILAQKRAEGVPEAELAQTEVMLYVDAAYLDHAVAVIKEHHGDVDTYIREVLLIDDTEIEQFRAKYLA